MSNETVFGSNDEDNEFGNVGAGGTVRCTEEGAVPGRSKDRLLLAPVDVPVREGLLLLFVVVRKGMEDKSNNGVFEKLLFVVDDDDGAR